MKKDFVKYVKNFDILGTIIEIITFGLAFSLFYGAFHERKYFLNRKLLLRLLKNNEITLKYDEILFLGQDIKVYKFEYNDNLYEIWYYSKSNNITLHLVKPCKTHEELDLIGLFTGDKQQKYLVKQIIKHIKKADIEN